MGISKNDPLTTFSSIEAIHIAYFYPERERESITKTQFFLWFYKLTLIWFEANFLEHIFDFQKRKMCNLAVSGMPLNDVNEIVITLAVFQKNW